MGVSLAVLWMSTHSRFAASFSFSTRLLQTDDGVQEQEFPGGSYYYVETPDDQE